MKDYAIVIIWGVGNLEGEITEPKEPYREKQKFKKKSSSAQIYPGKMTRYRMENTKLHTESSSALSSATHNCDVEEVTPNCWASTSSPTK